MKFNCEKKCEEWEMFSKAWLDAWLRLMSLEKNFVHDGRITSWNHCPWCGSKLVDRDEEVIQKIADVLLHPYYYSKSKLAYTHIAMAKVLCDNFNITLKEPNE